MQSVNNLDHKHQYGHRRPWFTSRCRSRGEAEYAVTLGPVMASTRSIDVHSRRSATSHGHLFVHCICYQSRYRCRRRAPLLLYVSSSPLVTPGRKGESMLVGLLKGAVRSVVGTRAGQAGEGDFQLSDEERAALHAAIDFDE
jgi:hypothetical protein